MNLMDANTLFELTKKKRDEIFKSVFSEYVDSVITGIQNAANDGQFQYKKCVEWSKNKYLFNFYTERKIWFDSLLDDFMKELKAKGYSVNCKFSTATIGKTDLGAVATEPLMFVMTVDWSI